MNARALAERLSPVLAELDEVHLVYLFGSQAEGTPGPTSDYDLGILVDQAAGGPRLQARLAHEVACALETDRVDVVLLNRAPIELAYAIIAQGSVLYERDVATRVEFEAQVLGRYGDYLPVLRAQRDDILRGDDYAQRTRRYRASIGRTERALGQIARTR